MLPAHCGVARGGTGKQGRAKGTIQTTGRGLGLCTGEGLQQSLDSVKAVRSTAAQWTKEDRRVGKYGWRARM